MKRTSGAGVGPAKRPRVRDSEAGESKEQKEHAGEIKERSSEIKELRTAALPLTREALGCALESLGKIERAHKREHAPLPPCFWRHVVANLPTRVEEWPLYPEQVGVASFDELEPEQFEELHLSEAEVDQLRWVAPVEQITWRAATGVVSVQPGPDGRWRLAPAAGGTIDFARLADWLAEASKRGKVSMFVRYGRPDDSLLQRDSRLLFDRPGEEAKRELWQNIARAFPLAGLPDERTLALTV